MVQIDCERHRCIEIDGWISLEIERWLDMDRCIEIDGYGWKDREITREMDSQRERERGRLQIER